MSAGATIDIIHGESCTVVWRAYTAGDLNVNVKFAYRCTKSLVNLGMKTLLAKLAIKMAKDIIFAPKAFVPEETNEQSTRNLQEHR